MTSIFLNKGDNSMRRIVFSIAICSLISINSALAQNAKSSTPEWSFNATIIEACSCPMFCQCYFSTSPASHSMADMPGMEGKGHDEAYCKFNNAFRVNKGTYNGVSLAGAKFWVSGDLGSEFG